MFVFGAFNSQGFIEQTVITSVWHEGGNVAEHAGYYRWKKAKFKCFIYLEKVKMYIIKLK